MRHKSQHRTLKARFSSKAMRVVAAGALALFGALVQSSGALKAHAVADVVCFPSCAVDDGRFVTVSLVPQTFGGNVIDVEFSAASTDTSFSYGIFDADATGMWDDATAPILKYELFADPVGNGTGTFLADSFTADAAFLSAHSNLVDNKWLDRQITNVTSSANSAQSGQLTDADNYHYHLRVTSTGVNAAGGTPSGSSNFKVRTSGALGIAPQAFSYIAALHSTVAAEMSAIYPLSGGLTTGNLTQTTYDGSWDFSFFVPSGTTQISVWDGDFDYGSRDCSKNQDADDPDTPNNYKDPATGLYITPWTSNAAPSGANNEGIPTNGANCIAGTAPSGVTKATGLPADDNTDVILRRSPSFGANVVYRLIGPDGTTAWDNLNPSGQQEWERFTVDADPNTPFDGTKMDYKVASLAAGVYRTHVEGVDIANLNAVYFSYRTLGSTPSGAPVPEDAFYLLSGTVFHDNSGNGVQDGVEAGVGGVAIVSIYASNGDFVATATTLADGSYSFRVARGSYFVVIEGSNFNTGKPLAGYYSTTGGQRQAAVAPSNGATVNFGYRLAPVAVNDSYLVYKNTPLNQAGPGIASNDTNIDNPGALLTAALVSGASNGSVVVGLNGGFAYTPNLNFVGTDTFTYRVNDGSADSNVATVTLTVFNDPPKAVNDTYSTGENVALVVGAPGILANDTDPNGDPLTLTLGATTTNGALTLNADGSFQYIPNTGFVGVDTFTYTVNDGFLNSLAATVTINVVGHPPVAVDDSAITLVGTPVNIPVVGNDSDPDHDTISITGTTLPSNGGIVANADGSITYTPNVGFSGVDTFTYTISDGHGGTSVALVTVTVNRRVATITAGGGTKVYGTADPALSAIATSGFGADLAGLTLTQDRVAGETVGHYAVTALATGGNVGNYTVTYTAGDFEITPATPTATATGGDFPYDGSSHGGSCTISDGLVGTLSYLPAGTTVPVNVGSYTVICEYPGDLNHNPARSTATITINARAVTITAAPKSKTYGDADPGLTYQLTNGTLAPGDSFSGSLTRVAGESVGTYAIQQGSVTVIGGNYAVTYVGANLTINPRLVTITADAKTKTVGSADPALTYQVTSGTLKAGDAFTGTLTRVAGETAGTYAILQGSVALSGNYTLTYVGANLTITPVVTPPPNPVCVVVARNDAYEVNKNQLLTVVAKGILRNDVDPYGRGLVVGSVNGSVANVGATITTAHGTVKVNADGSLTYKPANNYVGIDTFTYAAKSVYDNQVSAPATVTITVKAHYDGDGCDHDRSRNKHKDGDNCDHDKATTRHYGGDGCDHDRNRNGHKNNDGCDHDRDTRRAPNAHYAGDGDDHDRGRNGHREGDGCTHEQQTSHHNDGDNCDHERGVNGHKDGDDCDHDRERSEHRDGDGCDHDRGVKGHYKGDHCEHDGHHGDDDDAGTSGCLIQGSGQGKMTGGGTIGTSDARHGFELSCSANDDSNNLEVNWGTGNKFHLERLTSANCTKDPSINAERPDSSFNTYQGKGTGRFNGVGGATADWTFTDGGEPGRKDKATIVIKNAAGVVVLTVSGTISNGNQQAHSDRD